MKQYIVESVVANAEKHEARYINSYARVHGPERIYEVDLRFIRSLIEELGEAASALHGNHDHPLELELIQIAGICLNWLQARGVTTEKLAEIEAIDRVKHPVVA